MPDAVGIRIDALDSLGTGTEERRVYDTYIDVVVRRTINHYRMNTLPQIKCYVTVIALTQAIHYAILEISIGIPYGSLGGWR